ncbi:GFA family protein [Nocardia sp. XZ_19_385]|uniref:GFA family protein n=1 Tax=Nocardia sp. XZ_19_385 TaxID=2769488 RepID=UPI0018907B82|nr:GFA family protein [Nocardia sp. XZ_19_385]
MCSCPHCQKLSGGPVVAWTGFPNEKFRWISGEPDWYNTFPTTQRGSCPTCHSLVAARDSEGEFQDQMGITIMALDDATGITPVHQSCKDNAVSWLPVIETVDS